MTKDDRKLCFVIMGFGEKTDYPTGRTLNLDATYRTIIKPTVEAAGLRCVRADEIIDSSIIDTSMYAMLLQADLVIADISTANANALYELGVRHAFRPNATIVIKETEGRFIFDLNHLRTLEYRHLGIDIGFMEVDRVTKALARLIAESMKAQEPDSPVYTYLPTLRRPQLKSPEFERIVDETEARVSEFTALLDEGRAAVKASDFVRAAAAFAKADAQKPNEPYIVQQLALATYKAALPTKLEALKVGLRIIETLAPEQSNDPETLGIAGAIRKRLWQAGESRAHLDLATRYYGRGFAVRRDYYTGENYALCCDERAVLQTDPDEALFDRMTARKTREQIVRLLTAIEESDQFAQRSDRNWILATLANSHFALGNDAAGEEYETRFRAGTDAQWQIETYEDGKRRMLGLIQPQRSTKPKAARRAVARQPAVTAPARRTPPAAPSNKGKVNKGRKIKQ